MALTLCWIRDDEGKEKKGIEREGLKERKGRGGNDKEIFPCLFRKERK